MTETELVQAFKAWATRAKAILEAIDGEPIQAEPSIPDDLIAEWPVPPERFV